MHDVIQLSTNTAVALVVAYFLTVFASGRLLLWQFERRADARDAAMTEARQTETTRRSEDTARLQQAIQFESRRIGRLGEQVADIGQRLPLEYVRREDYIRGQTVIEAKLDAIATELKLVQINGARNAHRP